MPYSQAFPPEWWKSVIRVKYSSCLNISQNSSVYLSLLQEWIVESQFAFRPIRWLLLISLIHARLYMWSCHICFVSWFLLFSFWLLSCLLPLENWVIWPNFACKPCLFCCAILLVAAFIKMLFLIVNPFSVLQPHQQCKIFDFFLSVAAFNIQYPFAYAQSDSTMQDTPWSANTLQLW